MCVLNSIPKWVKVKPKEVLSKEPFVCLFGFFFFFLLSFAFDCR